MNHETNRNLKDVFKPGHKKKSLTFRLFNYRSINKKKLQIRESVMVNAIDCVYLTKTWLHDQSSEFSIVQVTLETYSFHHKIQDEQTSHT